MYKPSIDFTLDMDVKVRSCCSLFAISTDARSKVNPYHLWIVRGHAIFKGICFQFPLITGVIGTMFGLLASNGTPTYLSKTTVVNIGS